jgi:hypothetical protein
MHLLLNLVLAVLLGYLAYILLFKNGVRDGTAALLGVLVGILVFLIDIAGHLAV